jgi:hypothetical protein
MINLRLPHAKQPFLQSGAITSGPILSSSLTASTTVKLEDALSQSQLFFENGQLVLKNTQVVYSRGVIAFFVDRRKHSLRVRDMANPISMMGLPHAISGFERVNTRNVVVGDTINIGDPAVKYQLRSVVCAKTMSVSTPGVTSKANEDLFVGSESYVMGQMLPTTTGAASVIQKYDPMSVKTSGNTPISNTGVTTFAGIDVVPSHGIIFIYSQPDSDRR